MSEKRLFGRSVRLCDPEDSLSDAAQIMLEEECGCLLVRGLEAGDRVAGLITDRDICMAAYRYETELRAIRVRDAMSTELAGLGLREALTAAGVYADQNETRPLALLDEQGELLAIVALDPLGGRERVSLGGGKSVE
jgi:CBS domain-containing protein